MGIVKYALDPHGRELSPEAVARLDELTPDQIEENARTDGDNPPLTDAELARAAFSRDVRRLRRALGLSQKQFAERYAVNLARLRDWEHGRFNPDSVTRGFIKLIAHDPEGTRRILAAPQAALSSP